MGCSAGTPARTPFSVLEADVRSYKYTSTPSTEATAQLRRFVRARHLCTVVLPMSSESRRFAEVTGICLYCRLHWKYVRPCSQGSSKNNGLPSPGHSKKFGRYQPKKNSSSKKRSLSRSQKMDHNVESAVVEDFHNQP